MFMTTDPPGESARHSARSGGVVAAVVPEMLPWADTVPQLGGQRSQNPWGRR